MPAVRVEDVLTLPVVALEDATLRPRPVLGVNTAPSGFEGEGFPVRRAFAGIDRKYLDPFIHMDQMGEVEYAPGEPKGTPWHPHRGFETVTYMLAGRMRHADNKGHSGLLRPGSVQWMTAGRGIVHSEMPEQEEGLMWGFQLWVNLPAKDKMTAPRYQEFDPADVPLAELPGGVRVRVIAGTIAGVTGPVNGIATMPTLMDVELPAGGTFAHDLPAGHNVFVYPFEGDVSVGDPAVAVPRGTLAALGPGTRVSFVAGSAPSRVLLAAAQPLDEQIVRYGPFVMNTPDQIRAAIADFQAGRF